MHDRCGRRTLDSVVSLTDATNEIKRSTNEDALLGAATSDIKAVMAGGSFVRCALTPSSVISVTIIIRERDELITV